MANFLVSATRLEVTDQEIFHDPDHPSSLLLPVSAAAAPDGMSVALNAGGGRRQPTRGTSAAPLRASWQYRVYYPMAKVMVSLPDDLLRAIDVEAGRRGTTRSGLLQELAEETLQRRSIRRAGRMARNDCLETLRVGHGGGAAELVKKTRPGY